MIRRICIFTSALLLMAMPFGAQADPAYDLYLYNIAKTNRSVIATGWASTEKVRVSLFKQRSNGQWRLLQSKGVRTEDGEYRTRFDRPADGNCRVVVINAHDRVAEGFPCYIPAFSRGTAMLTPLVTSASVEIDALIADEDSERAYGLMYRPRMREDLGMAFLWPNDTSGGFWMKNTLIPLSIAFFDDSGTIVKILDMEPCSHQDEVEPGCPVYDPGVTYRGALEVNQGAFADWGIAEGDNITVTENP